MGTNGLRSDKEKDGQEMHVFLLVDGDAAGKGGVKSYSDRATRGARRLSGE